MSPITTLCVIFVDIERRAALFPFDFADIDDAFHIRAFDRLLMLLAPSMILAFRKAARRALPGPVELLFYRKEAEDAEY